MNHTGKTCDHRCATPCDHTDCTTCIAMKGEQPKRPTCNVWWDGLESAAITVEIDGCTPAQLWAAARLIERFADDLYTQSQIDRQRVQITEQLEAQGIAQELMGAKPRLVAARAVPTSSIKRSDA